MSTEPNKVIYSMVGVSKYYDKKATIPNTRLIERARWAPQRSGPIGSNIDS